MMHQPRPAWPSASIHCMRARTRALLDCQAGAKRMISSSWPGWHEHAAATIGVVSGDQCWRRGIDWRVLAVMTVQLGSQAMLADGSRSAAAAAINRSACEPDRFDHHGMNATVTIDRC